MSQEQLADRLGITRQSVSKWESGSAAPELSKLITLSEMFQVSIDYLVKDAEEPKGAEKEESRRLEEKVDNIVQYMKGYHYTSKATIKGVPFVCVRLSRRLGKEGVAKGIIAVGNVAIGVLSFGCISVGVISIGVHRRWLDGPRGNGSRNRSDRFPGDRDLCGWRGGVWKRSRDRSRCTWKYSDWRVREGGTLPQMVQRT